MYTIFSPSDTSLAQQAPARQALAQAQVAPVGLPPAPSDDMKALWTMIKHYTMQHDSVYSIPRNPGRAPAQVRIGGAGKWDAVTFTLITGAAGCFVQASQRCRPTPLFYKVNITIDALLALCERALYLHRAGQFTIKTFSHQSAQRPDVLFPAECGYWFVGSDPIMPASNWRWYRYERIEVA